MQYASFRTSYVASQPPTHKSITCRLEAQKHLALSRCTALWRSVFWATSQWGIITIETEARILAPFSTDYYGSSPFSTVQNHSEPFSIVKNRSAPFSTVQNRSALFRTVQYRSALQHRSPLLSEHRLSALHETDRKATTGLLSDKDADDDDYSATRPIVFSIFV